MPKGSQSQWRPVATGACAVHVRKFGGATARLSGGA